jgi:hypothetical protein
MKLFEEFCLNHKQRTNLKLLDLDLKLMIENEKHKEKDELITLIRKVVLSI